MANPQGSGFGDFCSLPDDPRVLEGTEGPMAHPEGSGFGVFCSLPDDPRVLEGTEGPMANPEGSGFGDFCSLPDDSKEGGMEGRAEGGTGRRKEGSMDG